jgi:flagellar protein FlaI
MSNRATSFLHELARPLQCLNLPPSSRVIRQYEVGLIRVKLAVARDGTLYYCVDEPEISMRDFRLATRLAEALVLEGYTGVPGLNELREVCKRHGVDYARVSERYQLISYYVAKLVSGYGPLFPLIRDPNIEEIAVNGPNRPVAVLTRLVPGSWALTNIVLDVESLNTLVVQLAHRAGRSVSVAHPYVEGMLPEGHRVAATYMNEVSRFGSSIVIRKHLSEPMTPAELVHRGMLTLDELAYLWILIEHMGSLLIVGPAAAGKTTLLQALLMLVPLDKRIVTIEDTPELNLSWHPHWDSLVTRHSYGGEAEDVDLYKLARFALRRRADYLVIGEVRGEEARILVHAASSGHGALATFHAENAEAALTRLRAPPIALGDSFIQSLWAIITVSRVKINGVEVRRVVAIDEIVPTDQGIVLNKVASSQASTSLEEITERSYRLKQIASSLGLSRSEIKAELKERRDLLEELVKDQVFSAEEFVSRITGFYAAKRWG